MHELSCDVLAPMIQKAILSAAKLPDNDALNILAPLPHHR